MVASWVGSLKTYLEFSGHRGCRGVVVIGGWRDEVMVLERGDFSGSRKEDANASIDVGLKANGPGLAPSVHRRNVDGRFVVGDDHPAGRTPVIPLPGTRRDLDRIDA